MSSPPISVITTCFNASEFLARAIESILGQSWSDFEFLLVDDGSTDDTHRILQEHAARDKRIVVLSKQHSGVTDSRNFGLQHAQGEFVATMDADDVALPQRLEQQVRAMRRDPALFLLGTNCVETDRDGQEIKRHAYPSDHASLVSNMEHMRPVFPHSSVMFRRVQALESGGYRTRFVQSEDLDLYLRLAEAGRVGCLQACLVMIRKHGTALTSLGGGRPQQVLGIAATVCHLRRKSGFSDPSQMSEEQWAGFLAWVERSLDEEGYLSRFDSLQELRKVWYARPAGGFVARASGLWSTLRRNPSSWKALFDRIFGYDIAIRLARAMPAFGITVCDP
jgi:glycosyltransferase involved in cell wall biosynthesis